MHEYWQDFIALLFPELCQACGEHLAKGEEIICLSCQFELPETEFHSIPENPMLKNFWGRVEVERAAAYLFFQKGGRVQNLLHQLKYNNQPEVGAKLGRSYGRQLHESGFTGDIDMVVPVPLHRRKQKQRGYNQSTMFAMGIAEVAGVDWSDNLLVRKVNSATQTQKTRQERWDNVKDIFAVSDASQLEGRHILIVDDVVTTGATLEACAKTILHIENTRVSVATIAFAE